MHLLSWGKRKNHNRISFRLIMISRKFIFQLSMFVFLLINFISAEDFVFNPPTKFTLDPKNIALHHPVKTDQLAAQLYFDQGLTQLYAFDNDTAYWSFLNASKIDPQMPMAYWGMAISLFPNFQMSMGGNLKKETQQAIEKAIDLSVNSSEVEREYINALSKRIETQSEDTNKKKYSEYLGNLSKKFPDDPDAAVLFAASLLDLQQKNWDKDGKPLSGIQEAVDALETVMKKFPNHVGANHYYIHIMDGSPFPEKALKSAERLKTLLPNAGHLLHMPSHIYLLVGDYHQAAISSEEALAADRRYINTYGIEGTYPLSYISHTLYFLTRIYSLEERYNDAMQAAEKLRRFYLPHFEHMPEMEYYVVMPLFISIHFHNWKKILKFPQPEEKMLQANLLWHFSRAIAHANLNNSFEASQERQLFQEQQKKVFEEKSFQNEMTKKTTSFLEFFMEAEIAKNEGKTSEAIKLFQQALKEQNSFLYNESLISFFSARQQLGALFLKLGNNKEAEQIYREDLNQIPNTSRSLFGLQESLKAQSKFYDLYWINQAFQQAYKYSDIDFTRDAL